MPNLPPFTINAIADRGDTKKERLVLVANRLIQEGSKFLIFDNTFDQQGNVSNRNRHLYGLKLKEDVSKDDFVVLYTKKGLFKTSTSKDSEKLHHFYYWGLAESVWNKDEDEVVHIVDASQIKTKKFDAVK